ncbi:hypothetical protein ABIE24_002566 [Mycetocola sp. 2940]
MPRQRWSLSGAVFLAPCWCVVGAAGCISVGAAGCIGVGAAGCIGGAKVAHQHKHQHPHGLPLRVLRPAPDQHGTRKEARGKDAAATLVLIRRCFPCPVLVRRRSCWLHQRRSCRLHRRRCCRLNGRRESRASALASASARPPHARASARTRSARHKERTARQGCRGNVGPYSALFSLPRAGAPSIASAASAPEASAPEVAAPEAAACPSGF